MPSLESDYPHYLRSKRSVDDRAVNERVLRRLASELEGRTRLRVLNVGAGIGGVIERFVERDVFPAGADISCTLVDIREGNVRAARERLPEWARAQGYTVTDPATASERDEFGRNASGSSSSRFRIDTGSRRIELEVIVADAFSIVEGGEWDLLVGQAFLDLFDLHEALGGVLPALSGGGYCYFPITFDGGTVFEPAVPGLESIDPRELERAFHDHIDRGGDSRAGRHLLTNLPDENVSVLAAGSSDWVVHALDGTYPAEEDAFLRFIIDTIAEALSGSETGDLPTEGLSEWRECRHEQIDEGRLVYIAHQIDVLGRVRCSPHE